jgi:hypothetical protein
MRSLKKSRGDAEIKGILVIAIWILPSSALGGEGKDNAQAHLWSANRRGCIPA